MPAGDEEGISSAHAMSITRKGTTCRDNFAIRTKSLSRRTDGPRVECAHAGANPGPAGPIPAGAVTFGKVLVTNVAASRPVPARSWSALAHPAERAPVPGRLRQRGEREVLAVAPGASRAVLVVLAAAGRADHLPIVAGRGVCRGRPQCFVPAGLCQPDQAAFARRIRRRRSEARSSSFRPPQVPYFSGREIA